MSLQTDEGYSEDPLNNAPDPSAFAAPFKAKDGDHSGSNQLSSAQLKTLVSSHIASLPYALPVELRMRA